MNELPQLQTCRRRAENRLILERAKPGLASMLGGVCSPDPTKGALTLCSVISLSEE